MFYGSYGNFMGNNHSCTLPNDPQQPTRPATMSFLLRMLWIQCKFLSRLLLSTKHLTIPFFRWLSTPLLTWTKGIRCLPQTVLSSSLYQHIALMMVISMYKVCCIFLGEVCLKTRPGEIITKWNDLFLTWDPSRLVFDNLIPFHCELCTSIHFIIAC